LVEEINKLGGVGYAVQCDHKNDGEVANVFSQIMSKEGRLDLLVNNAFTAPKPKDGIDDPELLYKDFWEQDGSVWDSFNNVGLRSHYVASVAAVPLMKAVTSSSDPRPLIVHVSSFGGVSYTFNVAYGVGKAGVDRMAKDMAMELKKLNVDCVSIWPGIVRTEKMTPLLADGDFGRRTGLYYPEDFIESPRLSGRVIAALYLSDVAKRKKRNGNVCVVAEVAREEGVVDINGSTPPSIRSLKFLAPAVILGRMEEKKPALEKFLKRWTPDILLPMSFMAGGPPSSEK
jgi:dehydrogenase/reductase SDR family protein 1